jgi:5,10-methylenetetrahydrofolate reductase
MNLGICIAPTQPFRAAQALKLKKKKTRYAWIKIKINLWICIAPTQLFRAAQALRAACGTQVTRQTGKLYEHSRTTTSRSQQQYQNGK